MKDIIDGILFLLICAMAYAMIYISCVAAPRKESVMNKLLILISALLLVGCSSYRPVADLKASKNANHFQEDRQHCKLLIKEEFNAFYAAWYDRELLARCLNGRGHNILNTYTIGN
jgi:hypothetical protein